MKPLKLGHVHLKVRDLARSTKFYTELLGLRVEEQVGNYAFLTDGVLHHVIALQALGSQAAPPAVRSIGLYHVAFEVASSSELSTVLQLLNEWRVQYTVVDHGISVAAYFEDPDGNGVEIYLDTRTATDGRDRWDGQSKAAQLE